MGSHIGCWRLAGGYGPWQARWRDLVRSKRFFEAPGDAEDVLDADGVSMFDWDQAQRACAIFLRESHTSQLVRPVPTSALP